MQANKIKAVVTNNFDECELTINIAERGLRINERLVTKITMFASNEHIGQLIVHWDAVDDSDYEHNTCLLMRDSNDSNDNTQTMGAFYWDRLFDEELTAILQEHGFSKEAASAVCGSEWGMQAVGEANYDAYEVGLQMLDVYDIELCD